MIRNNQYYSILDRFLNIAEKSGEKIAVISGNINYTYEYINKMSDIVANFLKRNLAESTQKIIGLHMKRSEKFVICLLGIMKSGNIYLPLDIDIPRKRMGHMIDESKCNLIISDFDFNKSEQYKCNYVNITTILQNTYEYNNHKLYTPEKFSYIIFTSGTSGMPKGVLISYEALCSFSYNFGRAFFSDNSKKMLSLSPISFDISLAEVLIPLFYGKTVYIASDTDVNNPRKLGDIIYKNEIDILQITPSRMEILISAMKDNTFLSNIKQILLGGEDIPKHLLNKLQKQKNYKIFNLYGPTETTIWCMYSDITRANQIVIGKPFDGNLVKLFDEEMNEINYGIGEILISGNQLTSYYLNDKKLIREKFIIHNNVMWYKTGDLGKYSKNQEIVFIGRKDNQIKYHGMRIELEEISNILLKYDSITNAVTILYRKKKVNILCSFIVANEIVLESTLKNYLKDFLPANVIPNAIIQLKTIPINKRGKINMQKLNEECEKHYGK